MTKKFVWGSVEHQREVAESIGYDFRQYNPSDTEQAGLLSYKAKQALLSGKSISGKQLSPDDMSLLEVFAGYN